MNSKPLALVVFLLLTTPSVWGEMPPTMKVGSSELVLNGTGVRVKGPFKLYNAGLYLNQHSNQADSIVANDEFTAIRIEVTSRLVSQERMVASLDEGFKLSTGGNLAPLGDKVDRFRSMFSGKITRGDVFELVYTPGTGTSVNKNGNLIGTIESLEFKQALFGIWIGKKPVDATLKKLLVAGVAKTAR